MKVAIVDTKGKKSEKQVELKDALWTVPFNADLLAQVVHVYRSNMREGNASAKGRGDVRGGGRKPWKQKGTGRARHGSIRSPLWVGGGVTFVPQGKNWTRRINKQMKSKALCSILSTRLANEQLYFVEVEKIERSQFDSKVKNVLITDSGELYKKLRNGQNVQVVRVDDLNAMDVLAARNVYFDSNVVDKFEQRVGNEK